LKFKAKKNCILSKPKTVREILALKRKEILKQTKTVKNCGIVDEIKNPIFPNFHSSTQHNINNTNVLFSSSTTFHSRITDSQTSNAGEKLEDINHIFKSTTDLFSHQVTDSWLQTTTVDLKTSGCLIVNTTFKNNFVNF